MYKSEQSTERRHYQKPKACEIEALSAQLLIANQKLEETNEKLQHSESARNEILSNLSHDLRAPLTAMRSALDYLQSWPNISAEDLRSMLAVMDRRCTTLEHMAEDLFLLTIMDLPGYKLELRPLRLVPFLEEYFEMQCLNSVYDGRQLLCEISSDLDVVIEADPKRLVQVLDNLFSNALKFTKHGDEIALGCRMVEGQAEICVRDSGVGIPGDKLEAIFERTYTLSDARAPNSGSGLGLSIVRSIVKKHGGQVWCESAAERGSIFVVRLAAVNL